jgi:hypothetical protein
MNLEEARRIWGPDMPEDVLKEWVRVVNKRKKTFLNDDPKIPKGVTVELDSDEFHGVTTDDGDDIGHDRVRDPPKTFTCW